MVQLSLNDVPQVRRLFEDFHIHPVQTTYCSRKIAQDVGELLIANYTIQQKPDGKEPAMT